MEKEEGEIYRPPKPAMQGPGEHKPGFTMPSFGAPPPASDKKEFQAVPPTANFGSQKISEMAKAADAKNEEINQARREMLTENARQNAVQESIRFSRGSTEQAFRLALEFGVDPKTAFVEIKRRIAWAIPPTDRVAHRRLASITQARRQELEEFGQYLNYTDKYG